MKVDHVPHPEHGSQIDIEGYRSCRNEHCGALVLLEIAERTGGLCTPCFRSELGRQLTEVEVISRGQRQTVDLTKRRYGPRVGKGDRNTHRKADKAKLRAMRRLRTVFPELYDIFYAEERARAGLDAWSVDAVLGEVGEESMEQTLGFALVYAHLTNHGVDVDGLEVQPENEDSRPR